MDCDPDTSEDGDQTAPDDIPDGSTMANSVTVPSAISENTGRRRNKTIDSGVRGNQHHRRGGMEEAQRDVLSKTRWRSILSTPSNQGGVD